jgi:hypothetical protein
VCPEKKEDKIKKSETVRHRICRRRKVHYAAILAVSFSQWRKLYNKKSNNNAKFSWKK